MSISSNIQSIQKTIKLITDQPVTLVAVTKTRSIDEIKEIIAAGVMNIGENRLQEAEGKLPHITSNITRHFIGHLQTNKVEQVVRLFDMIQSVDSLKLAQKINSECEKIGKIMPILIQVNTSNEPQKGGINPEESETLIKKVADLPYIKVQGLMTLAMQIDDEEKIRNCFKTLKKLFDSIQITNVKMKWLSMGMSGDYKIALKEGANMIRIGRGIFQ